jgi:hypothetical protein
MMGLFSYMYIQSFVENGSVTVSYLFHQAISLLTPSQQVELYHALREFLVTALLIPGSEEAIAIAS